MQWRSERSFVRMEWEEFVRWFELRDAFILLQNDRIMHIVVKRVLTPAEEESIRTALRSSGVPLGWRKRASG